MSPTFPLVIEGLLHALRCRGWDDGRSLQRIAAQAVAMGVDTVDGLQGWVRGADGLDPDSLEALLETIAPCDRTRIGPYHVIAHLADGGMGSAWLALRPGDEQRLVVVKTIKADMVDDADHIGRFRREIRISLLLSHKHVVRCLDAGQESDGSVYLVLEFIAGGDLDHLVSRYGRLDEDEVLQIAHHTALGLMAAHDLHLVHRDIKPGNLFIDPDGHVKVADFGLARATHAGWTILTQKGTIVGSLHYMSPEQVQGVEDIDTRSDIYALGATLYFALTGRPPFDVEESQAILASHLRALVPDVRALRPDISAPVAAIIRTCMAKKRERRYQNPKALAKAVAKVLSAKGLRPGHPLPARLVADLLPVISMDVLGQKPSDCAADAQQCRRASSTQTLVGLAGRPSRCRVHEAASAAAYTVHPARRPASAPLVTGLNGDAGRALADDWLVLRGGGALLCLFARTLITIGKLPEPPIDLCLRLYPIAKHREACMYLSRTHLRLSAGPHGLTAEDLCSANGSRLQGFPLQPGRPVTIAAGGPQRLNLAGVVSLDCQVIPRRGQSWALIGDLEAAPGAACGLDSEQQLDGVVLSRPFNLPELQYAMVLRQLCIGGPGADIVLPGLPADATVELARFAGRWLQRCGPEGPWGVVAEGQALSWGPLALMPAAGGYAVYDEPGA